MSAPKQLSRPQYALLGQLVALPEGTILRRDGAGRPPLNVQSAHALEKLGYAIMKYDTTRSAGGGWGIKASEAGRLAYPTLRKPETPAPPSCAQVAERAEQRRADEGELR